MESVGEMCGGVGCVEVREMYGEVWGRCVEV